MEVWMNKEDRSLFLPVLALLIAIIAFFVSWKMLMPQIADNQAKIKAYDADIELAELKTASLSDANKKIASMSGLVNQLLVAIPEGVNSPDLIAEIETVAAVNQVLLPSISPPGADEQSSEGSPDSSSTTISVSGGFTNIYNFISSLENSIRFLKITSLSISSTEVDNLSATITFDVFKRPNANNLDLTSEVDYE
jgi:Tfp pilus assembly protein PilO